MLALLSIYRLPYKQAIQASMRTPEAKGAGLGACTPGKISLRGPGFWVGLLPITRA